LIESSLSSGSGVTDAEGNEFLLFVDGEDSADCDDSGVLLDVGDLLDVV
jgi:hypothetical protein